MSEFMAIICIAIVIETLTEYIKKAFPIIKGKTGIIFVFTALLGIASAIAFSADIFEELGFMSTIPYFGQALTGLLCAGGSNMVYDIISRITNGSNTTLNFNSTDVADNEED